MKCKYADIQLAEEYNPITAILPEYIGVLEPGDPVIVEHHGEYKPAEVVSVDMVREHTVRATVCSKWKRARYEQWKADAEKARKAQIAMDKRLEALERDGKWKEAATDDPVMASLYQQYGEAALAIAD